MSHQPVAPVPFFAHGQALLIVPFGIPEEKIAPSFPLMLIVASS